MSGVSFSGLIDGWGDCAELMCSCAGELPIEQGTRRLRLVGSLPPKSGRRSPSRTSYRWLRRLFQHSVVCVAYQLMRLLARWCIPPILLVFAFPDLILRLVFARDRVELGRDPRLWRRGGAE